MFNKILVALDYGDTCDEVFKAALAMAKVMQAKLMLLSVLTDAEDSPLPLSIYPGLGYYPVGTDENRQDNYLSHYKRLERKGLYRLQGYADTAAASGVDTTFTQTTGTPNKDICELANSWKANLIMVGSHRRRGLGELLLGSVSSYVMHHAPCSVMVVHGDNHHDLQKNKGQKQTANL